MVHDKIDEIVVQLKILGQIEKDDKVSTRAGIRRDPPDPLQGIKRWWYAEGRKITIESVSEIIDRAILITFETLEIPINRSLPSFPTEDVPKPKLTSKRAQFLHMMLESFDRARKGIMCLQETYSEDSETSIELELIIQKIDNYTTEFRNMLFESGEGESGL